jgi:RNA polymerase sigma factor (sigma-70 family)
VHVQELVNICVVTFIEKISKFDPVHASGAKPFTYLGFWMWQAMQRALPDLVDESGRTVSSSRRINSRSVPVTFFIQSLFAPVNHDEDSTLCETIPDPDSVASDVAADERRAGIVVRHLLREFGPLERMIIEARYYEGKTLEETADVVHALGLTKRRLSREAIRQNEKRTLERLGLALVRTGLAQ